MVPANKRRPLNLSNAMQINLTYRQLTLLYRFKFTLLTCADPYASLNMTFRAKAVIKSSHDMPNIQCGNLTTAY